MACNIWQYHRSSGDYSYGNTSCRPYEAEQTQPVNPNVQLGIDIFTTPGLFLEDPLDLKGPSGNQDPSGPINFTCDVSLFERPVPTALKSPGRHTYLDITENDVTYDVLLDGGPSGFSGAFFGRLWGYDNIIGSTLGPSDRDRPSNIQVGSTYEDLDCFVATDLITRVGIYDAGRLARYDAFAIPGTYNGNSFTYTLLKDVGLLSFIGAPSGYLPGWRKVVPGL